jgi:hypothetical protein
MSSFAVISTFSVIPTERSPRHYWNKNCMCLKIAGITTIVNQHHVFFRFESKDRCDDRFWKQSAGPVAKRTMVSVIPVVLEIPNAAAVAAHLPFGGEAPLRGAGRDSTRRAHSAPKFMSV